jgi:hypothetical protein
MTSEQISKFIEANHVSKHPLKIDFKTRSSIVGLFIQEKDYDELKSKNFWRIVAEGRIKDWKSTNDTNLARIFNGQEFTRLSVAS